MTLFLQQLKSLPWATLGRRESFEEIVSRVRAQRSHCEGLANPPKFSLIIPIDRDVDITRFALVLASLKAQSYPFWEAIFVVKGTQDALRILTLHGAEDGKFSFRWFNLAASSTLADLKNSAIERMAGQWWMVVEPDQILHPSALYLLSTEILKRPAADVLYTNEIFLGEDGRTATSLLSKPELSWIDLIHFPYLGRCVAVKATSAPPSQPFDSYYPVFHEMDFHFRQLEQERTFHHVPYFLSFRIGAPDSFGKNLDEWRRVVESHLRRKGFPAAIDLGDCGGRRRLRVQPVLSRANDRMVSAVICFRDRADLTFKSIERLVKQRGQVALELILVNNGSKPEEAERLKGMLSSNELAYRSLDYPGEFNFARMNNRAVRELARGDFILLLNNDVFWNGEATLDTLVAWAAQSTIGTVGIRLVYPDGRLQHSGLIARFGGEARMVRITNQKTEDAFTYETKEVFVNTFAACLFRRQVFDRIGGLRELEYYNGFGDVVFNFECLRQGWKNIYLGEISAEHLESASRGQQQEYWEEVGLEREFPDLLAKMLRSDLGENRVPGGDLDITGTLKEAISSSLAARAPMLRRGIKSTFNLFRSSPELGT